MATLCVLTELTFRVYPKPQIRDQGFVFPMYAGNRVSAALRKIAHSALEPAGPAYLPGNMLPKPLKSKGGRARH